MLDALRGLRCRAVSRRLGPGPSPSEVVRRSSGMERSVGLVGAWAGGGALIASEPLLVLPDGVHPHRAIATQPVVDRLDGAGRGRGEVVGGGWFGWLSFDGPSRLAFYDHLLRFRDGVWFFEALWSDERDGLLQARSEELAALLEGLDATTPWTVGAFGGASMARHLDAVERAVEWIRAGEIYQVNICSRLDAPFSGSPAGLFADLSHQLAPRFGAFVDGGDRFVAGVSPELFLRRRAAEIVTAPIKGTWPRADGSGSEALRRSAKDAAENVMIVDLMRNDLGRVCEIGSVRASTLLDVEAHPGVWHLVSTVEGAVRDDVDDGELLDATFPPGSVTGAPKVRSLDAIAQLEAGRRGAYTGAVGFASPCWGLELAVAIRTFEIAGTRVELGVGGGVTADSVPMLEWRECLHKAAPLLTSLGAPLRQGLDTAVVDPDAGQLAGGLFETVLVMDGACVRLADHLARLDRSCRELFGAGLPDGVASRARALARTSDRGRAVLRIVRAPEGDVTMTVAPAADAPVSSSARTVRDRTGLWRHKWADRRLLAGWEQGEAVPLFVAPDATVLETSRGNVFLLSADGVLVTPPLRDDLLPGITRRALLDHARDVGRRTELREFTLDEMRDCAPFWTSSLSGAVPIHVVDGVELPRCDEEIRRLGAALIPLANRRFVR